MNNELGTQDVKILKLLQQDASLTTQEISEKLNMSQSPCWRKINKMQQDSLIEKRVAILNREKLGMDVVVFSTINLSTQGREYLEDFEAEVKLLPEVLECYTMAGSWDYMLKIVAKNIRHYEIFVREKLTTLPHIGEVHSHIAVTEIKNSTELPLATQFSR
ncbi:MAG TPA: AsnC family transcriptional regulator [Cellvibrionales bacterium]|jgi:Lrp/AsnC family transcriptional regulator|nr:AsnC family transcriptional regulator [Cellvibrionales bacterium]